MAYPLQPLSVTSATYTLNEENVGNGAIISIDRAAGCAITLPTSVGSGQFFRILIGTTISSNTTTIKVANSTDVIYGNVMTHIATGATSASFGEAATGTDDTITMNGTTTGGIAGSYIELIDVKAGFWKVDADLIGSGTLATSLSATV